MTKKKVEKKQKKSQNLTAKSEDKIEKKALKDSKNKNKNGNGKNKKLKMKLSEHTSFKNLDKKKTKNRQPVWVKKFHIEYEKELNKLQIELLKLQKHVIANDMRIMMLFEGRDAAGKGGTIKRIMEHLNPRGAKIGRAHV